MTKQPLKTIVMAFFLVLLFVPSASFAAETAENEKKKAEAADTEKKEDKQKKEAQAGAEKEKPENEPVTTGVFYGHVIFIHPDKISIIVKPFQENFGRQLFYLDSLTKYTKDRKRMSWKRLDLGQKVAVRYFAEGRFAMAEEIYIVEGDFRTADYKGRKKRKKR